MAALESTLIHLPLSQKRRLAQLAKRRHTSLAREVRNAIECYLAFGVKGIDPKAMAEAAKSARQAVEAMTVQAKRENRQLESVLRALKQSKKEAS
ncbi:MAG: hypothetical protein D6690_13460 [Nitrospirae bacterium]|nr:MAG: hypothetical protein D6690_13460 [Nitrospirota bacterium]